MISKLYNFWQILKSNLWFVPAVFCLGFLGFTTAFYFIEIRYFQDIELPQFFFQGSTDDAKSVTVTLLSAMITMATLAISITMVVLSLAASQLGPRLIKTFMADRTTKDYIGLFFGTVMACFVLTIILHSRTSEAATPQITISLVFFICLVNLFVLLGFVHHVAQSSIADNVILKVSRDLQDALRRLTKDVVKHRYKATKGKAAWPKDFDQMSTRLYFKNSGYVQNIDYDHLMELACEEDLRIQINFKAGHFLVRGEDGVRIYTKIADKADDLQDRILNCFIVGSMRTGTQDIEYSIRHLVEIAIRALSPGINDSFTAMNVLDHISAALALLFEKDSPNEAFYDDRGTKRMQTKQSDEADVIFSALDQIRFNGKSMPGMIRHMLKKLKILVELAPDELSKAALKQQLNALCHDIENIQTYISDKKELKAQAKALVEDLS